MTEVLSEKKKNGQIKGLTNFVTHFKILSQAVPEKTLTEKKLTDRHTNIVTERTETINRYMLRMPGV